MAKAKRTGPAFSGTGKPSQFGLETPGGNSDANVPQGGNGGADPQQEEASRRRNEELVRQGVRVAGLGIFEHDHRSDKIEYSDEMRQMMGFGVEEEITIPRILQ